MKLVRLEIKINGLVQGVGFRPHVFIQARKYKLSGFVFNNNEGVVIEAQGDQAELNKFCTALQQECPPLARIDSFILQEVPLQSGTEFIIKQSQTGKVNTSIIPDAAICKDCLAEMLNTQDRRYQYPFLNCTHCGPRYTITNQLPYDRKQTSMAIFPLCNSCKQEYENPLDRRFHAQPTACSECGPELSHNLQHVLNRIKAGDIIALKGLGGFHLVCDATNDQAVRLLRERKKRDAKPFAVMAANIASIKQMANCNQEEANILSSSASPILLLACNKSSPVKLATEVAPGLNSLGVMLPYTPIHHLLFFLHAQEKYGSAQIAAQNLGEEVQDLFLVMTSANPSGEPLITDNNEARQKLNNIADIIVTHNRNIVVRTDDSVVTVVNNEPFFIRRARGYVPKSIKLSKKLPNILSVGAELKNTICLIRGDEAFVSQHIGDLDTPEGYKFYCETVEHLQNIIGVKPEVVAHDLHPDFYSTRFAQKIARDLNIPLIGIQHHYAHVASVIAEHNIQKPILGLALDGYGMGENKDSWGGELILFNGKTSTRIGNFAPLMQPGGNKAAEEPWRMAASALYSMGKLSEISEYFSEKTEAKFLMEILDKNINSPLTSSCGRLFDSACGLIKLQLVSKYEGEAPMLFEALVTQPKEFKDGYYISPVNKLDLLPCLAEIYRIGQQINQTQNESKKLILQIEAANIFHGTLISALSSWVINNSNLFKINEVVLSGGCFLNKVILEGLFKSLQSQGIKIYLPRDLPPNDGGISLGQAWLAGLQLL